MVNRLTLAVAGSRKTQGVVEHCASLPRQRRALVLTFTQANQLELRKRLARYAGDHVGVEVLGWYTFLLRHFAHPFLPFKFPGKRVRGFNFEGRPHRLAKGFSRFFDAQGAAYSCELSHLAYELIAASRGALLRRLQCVSDEVLVDEVCGFRSMTITHFGTSRSPISVHRDHRFRRADHPFRASRSL